MSLFWSRFGWKEGLDDSVRLGGFNGGTWGGEISIRVQLEAVRHAAAHDLLLEIN